MSYHQVLSFLQMIPSVVFNVDASTKELNDDLAKVQDWVLQWKMSFNPGISKQPQEVIFSSKLKKTPHPPLIFNSNQVNKTSSQKHLGIILDHSKNISVVVFLRLHQIVKSKIFKFTFYRITPSI